MEAEIDCKHLNADLSGASTLDLIGKVNLAVAECSGASTLKSYGLNIQNLDIDLSGASQAELTVENEMNIEASGASHLNYKGSASIKSIDLSGASRIKKRD